jgi:4-amino-4-deoxy-L-arabinose transferase-like glycosyltransferase
MRSWLSRIPVIGPMFLCSWKDHGSALKDFSITIAFSSITFWLSAIILSVLEKNREVPYVDLLSSTVQGGELYIFSLGILGPILLIIMDDGRKTHSFPSGTWLMFLLVVSAVICGGLFALMRTTAALDFRGLDIDRRLAISISFWAAGGACFLRYLTIAYNKSLSKFNAEALQADEQNFKNAFASRHGKGS